MVKPTYVRLSKQEMAITKVILEYLDVDASADKVQRTMEIKRWSNVDDPLVKIEAAPGMRVEDFLPIFRVSTSTPTPQQAKVVLMITKSTDGTEYDPMVVPISINLVDGEQVVKLVRLKSSSEYGAEDESNPMRMPKPQLVPPQEAAQEKQVVTSISDSGIGKTVGATSVGADISRETAHIAATGEAETHAADSHDGASGLTMPSGHTDGAGVGGITTTSNITGGTGTDARHASGSNNDANQDEKSGGNLSGDDSYIRRLENLSVSNPVIHDQEMITIIEQPVPERIVNPLAAEPGFQGFRTHDRTSLTDLNESKLEDEPKIDGNTSGYQQQMPPSSSFMGLQPARLMIEGPKHRQDHQQTIVQPLPVNVLPMTVATGGNPAVRHDDRKEVTIYTPKGVDTPAGNIGMKTSNTAFYTMNDSWGSEIQRKPQSTATKNGVESNRLHHFTTSSLIGEDGFDVELEESDLANCLDGDDVTRRFQKSDEHLNATFTVNQAHRDHDRVENVFVSMNATGNGAGLGNHQSQRYLQASESIGQRCDRQGHHTQNGHGGQNGDNWVPGHGERINVSRSRGHHGSSHDHGSQDRNHPSYGHPGNNHSIHQQATHGNPGHDHIGNRNQDRNRPSYGHPGSNHSIHQQSTHGNPGHDHMGNRNQDRNRPRYGHTGNNHSIHRQSTLGNLGHDNIDRGNSVHGNQGSRHPGYDDSGDNYPIHNQTTHGNLGHNHIGYGNRDGSHPGYGHSGNNHPNHHQLIQGRSDHIHTESGHPLVEQDQPGQIVLHSEQTEQQKQRPLLKTQSQLVFPTWTGEGDPEEVLSDLEYFIELGYSEFETILGFCTANQLTAFLRSLPKQCQKNFKLFVQEFRKEYGINLSLAGARFDRIQQRSDEKLSVFLNRVKRGYNASVKLPLDTPLGPEAALVVRRKFLFGLRNRKLIKYLLKKNHWSLDSLPQRIRDLEKTAEAVDLVTEQQDQMNAVLWNSAINENQPQVFMNRQADTTDMDLCFKILPIHEQIRIEDIPLTDGQGQKFCIRHNVPGHTVLECGENSRTWLKTIRGRCDYHGWGGHTNEYCRELFPNNRVQHHARCNRCGGGHKDSECRSNSKGVAAYNKVRMGKTRPKQMVDFNVNSGQNAPQAVMTTWGPENMFNNTDSSETSQHCLMAAAGYQADLGLDYDSEETSESDGDFDYS